MKKLDDMTKEELEVMNYDDIAFLILEKENTKMKINELFKKICDLLSLSEEQFLDQIADFFEILTTDKRFILLSDGYWDLKNKHSEKVIIEEDDDDIEELPEENEENPEEDENDYYDEDNDDDSSDDDLKDLVVIDEEDENAM